MWKTSKKIQVYCAFCRIPKKVYARQGISLIRLILSLVLALPVSYAVLGELNPAILFVFIGFMGLGEALLQLRRRLSMVCRHCGFDPVIYVQSPAKAAERVKVQLERRKTSPEFLLGPALNLPRRRKPVVRRSVLVSTPMPKSGSLLSKRT